MIEGKESESFGKTVQDDVIEDIDKNEENDVGKLGVVEMSDFGRGNTQVFIAKMGDIIAIDGNDKNNDSGMMDTQNNYGEVLHNLGVPSRQATIVNSGISEGLSIGSSNEIVNELEEDQFLVSQISQMNLN